VNAATASAPPIVADETAIRGYLETLYGTADDGFLPVWTWPDKRTEWFSACDLDAAAAAVKRLADRDGVDVYHGMGLHPAPLGSSSRGLASGVCAIPGLYMDIDIFHPNPKVHAETALPRNVGEVTELLSGFPLPPTLLIDSGHGVYAHWLMRELLTLDDAREHSRAADMLERLQREIRRQASERGWRLDTTSDLARVLRPVSVPNRKDAPVLTRLLHDSGERHTLEEIEDRLPERTSSRRRADSDDANRPALAPIYEGCAFLAHCRDDARTLTEPEWHAGFSIVSLCDDGERQAHAMSEDYPRYAESETQQKFERARAADRPYKCATIEDRFGDAWCADCQHRGKITSPIQLGSPQAQFGRNGKTPHADAGKTPPEEAWPTIDQAAYYGLAGDIVRTIEPHTEGDPVAILLNSLAMFGSAAGASAFAPVGASRHRGNLFVVNVGETARARKGTAHGESKRVMVLADELWAVRVMGGLSSGEGLIHAVRDAEYKVNKEGELKLADPGVKDKRLQVVEEEFSSVLRVAGRDGNTLSEQVRRAWDGSDLRTLTRSSPLVATRPHISILGHITRTELLRELSETNQVNGFANRFIFSCVRRSKLLPHGGMVPDSAIAALVDRVRRALDVARRRGAIRRNAEADHIWEGVYSALTAERPGMLGAITARAEAQVLRLSLLYALLDSAPEIQRPHLEAALAIWEYAEDSARFIFGDATGDPIADQILAALRGAGKMTQTQISELFAKNQKAGRLQQALATLLNAGMVRTWQDDSTKSGRPPVWWEATS
jgi:hypothetical protein